MSISPAFNAPYDTPQVIETEPIPGAPPTKGKTYPGWQCRVECVGSDQLFLQFPPELSGQFPSEQWSKFISEFNMLQNARKSTEPECTEWCAMCLFCCLCPVCGGCSKWEEFNKKNEANHAGFRNQLSECVSRWNTQAFKNHNLAAHLGFERRHIRKIRKGTVVNGQQQPDTEDKWWAEYAVIDVVQINPVVKVAVPVMQVPIMPMPMPVVSVGMPQISVTVQAPFQAPLGFPLCLVNAHNQKVQYNGSTFAQSPNEAGWEQWVLEDAGQGHCFISNPHFNVRISAKDDRATVGPSPNRSGWERWQMAFPVPGKVQFTSAHGMRLSQDQNGKLYQSPNRDAWETFTVLPKGSPGGMLQAPGMLM